MPDSRGKTRSPARALWAGEVPLARAFWGYAVAGGLALNLATTALSLALFAAAAPTVLAVVAHALPLPYNAFVFVAVWRSAGRYGGERRWADLARVAIVPWTILVSVA